MTNVHGFALATLLVAAAGLVAVLSNRVVAAIGLPAPAVLLGASALAVQVVPGIRTPPRVVVEDLVTLALLAILFDGGLHIGLARFRPAAATIGVVGVAGTFVTALGGAVFLHVAVGLDWYPAALVATAVAPTDPAVVFSVLGQREIAGRTGTVLEGESGANDPVGIALLTSLLSAGSLSGGAVGRVAGEFALQMAVGLIVGVTGGYGLVSIMRRVPLPSEGLYPLRTLAFAVALFGLATLAHGSGFLAVFVAGIVAGDARAPYKREVERFHAALASLGEIVAFVVLGLTVDLDVISRADVWVPGLVFAAVLAFVLRPVLVAPLLARSGLERGERLFVLLAGLKGAVPILLGEFVLAHHVPAADRLYGIVIIVVVFSVVVQGSLVPAAAHRLGVAMRPVDPEPWALGVRLRDEPEGAQQFTVAAGAPADGASMADLDRLLPAHAWIGLLVRGGRVVAVDSATRMAAGDAVLVVAAPGGMEDVRAVFSGPAPGPPRVAG